MACLLGVQNYIQAVCTANLWGMTLAVFYVTAAAWFGSELDAAHC